MNKENGDKYVGMIVLGGLITGMVGLLAAPFSIAVNANYIAAAIFVVGSALAFGLLANAVFRK